MLEHVAGAPVHRVLAAGRVEAAVAEWLARQVLEALEHVHARGWLHRDLKPSNLLVDTGQLVKLTDFGLAVRLGASSPAGTISGSLPYVAPEVLLGLALDERADLYGLGILLYQLVTGELPVKSLEARDVLAWHLAGPPADPCRVRPRLPARLGGFIRRLAARDRAARPRDAREALRLLGVRSLPAARGVPATPDRAARARLRLALDAVRLGAVRVHRLPGASDATRALLAEASVWAQARGMRLHRIRGAGSGRLSLARFVLGALGELGAAGAACARRHELERWLPLRLVGDLPVIDRSRDQALPAERARAANAAEPIATFLLACTVSRPTVIVLERSALGEPVVRAVARRLLRAAARRTSALGDHAGLLVLLAPDDPEAAHGRRPAKAVLPGRLRRVSRSAPRPPDAARGLPC